MNELDRLTRAVTEKAVALMDAGGRKTLSVSHRARLGEEVVPLFDDLLSCHRAGAEVQGEESPV